MITLFVSALLIRRLYAGTLLLVCHCMRSVIIPHVKALVLCHGNLLYTLFTKIIKNMQNSDMSLFSFYFERDWTPLF
jgi:hypothetical protein